MKPYSIMDTAQLLAEYKSLSSEFGGKTSTNLDLFKVITERLLSDVSFSLCTGEEIDEYYRKRFGQNPELKFDFEAMGLYRPISPKPEIMLCRERIMEVANEIGIDVNLLHKLVFLHEIGHHVFDKSAHDESSQLFSEGAANFFVYLIGDEVTREALFQLSNFQCASYRYYRTFIDWENVDKERCYKAFEDLARGDWKAFYVAFLIHSILSGSKDIRFLLDIFDKYSDAEWITLLRSHIRGSQLAEFLLKLLQLPSSNIGKEEGINLFNWCKRVLDSLVTGGENGSEIDELLNTFSNCKDGIELLKYLLSKLIHDDDGNIIFEKAEKYWIRFPEAISIFLQIYAHNLFKKNCITKEQFLNILNNDDVSPDELRTLVERTQR